MLALSEGALMGCLHIQELLLHHAWQETAEYGAAAETLWQAYVESL